MLCLCFGLEALWLWSAGWCRLLRNSSAQTRTMYHNDLYDYHEIFVLGYESCYFCFCLWCCFLMTAFSLYASVWSARCCQLQCCKSLPRNSQVHCCRTRSTLPASRCNCHCKENDDSSTSGVCYHYLYQLCRCFSNVKFVPQAPPKTLN